MQQEWGEGLIRSWNSAHWVDLPQRVGDKIGRLIGARPGTGSCNSTHTPCLGVVPNVSPRSTNDPRGPMALNQR